jgi:hypothetical protein
VITKRDCGAWVVIAVALVCVVLLLLSITDVPVPDWMMR